MATIVFPGDSNDAVYGTDVITGPITAAQTYAQIAGAALGYSSIVNSGVPGLYASGVPDDLQNKVLQYSPAAMVSMLGTNDMAHAYETLPDDDVSGAAVAISTYLDTIERLATMVYGTGIRGIIMSPPLTQNGSLNERFLGDRVAEGLSEIAMNYNMGFLDVAARMRWDLKRSTARFAQWFANPADPYHLGSVGRAWLAGLITSSQLPLQPLLGPSPASIQTLCEHLLDTAFGNITSFTLRTVWPLALMSTVGVTAGPVWIRPWFRGRSTEPLTLGRVFVGPKSGSIGMTAAAKVLTNGASGVTIPTGQLVPADWTLISWNLLTDLVFSMYCSGDGSADGASAAFSITGSRTALKSGDDAATLAVSGYDDAHPGYLSVIEKIEIASYHP